jgi:hypothetical protein
MTEEVEHKMTFRDIVGCEQADVITDLVMRSSVEYASSWCIMHRHDLTFAAAV